MGTKRNILNASQRAALLAVQQADLDSMDYFSCSDFGADFESMVAGVNLLQPTTKYRLTTVGKLLTESLDELRQENKITDTIYEKCLRQFDRSIMNVMTSYLTTRLSFRATKLKAYKFLDNEWCFILDEVEFREYNYLSNVQRMKILAFDGRSYAGVKSGGKRRWKKSEKSTDGGRRKKR